VETRCPPELAHARLAERQTRGDDPSDAGPERLADSAAAWEPIEGVPEWAHWVIDTRHADEWLDELGARLLELG
jgi:predicted kinase